MNEIVKKLVDELERKKNDLIFLNSRDARVRREVYNELIEWAKEKWILYC